MDDGRWDIPVHKQNISPTNYPLPEIHASIYPTQSPTICNLVSTLKQKRNNLTIKHVDPLRHLTTLIDEQIKHDKKDSRIHPHLQQLDILAHENIDNNKKLKKQNFVRTLYPHSKCGVILRKRQTHSDLAEYLHAACLGPVKSTFLKAINKGFFKTWPGLTDKLVKKHLHPTTYTAKGHLSQTRQHLQSTKTPSPEDNSTYLENIKKNITALRAKANSDDKKNLEQIIRDSWDEDAFPSSDIPNQKTNEVVYAIFDSSPSGLAYIDLTGRFPYRSARGNEYIIVGYHYDANAILATALKNRQAATITEA